MFDGPTLVPIDADDETTVIHIIKSLQKLEFIADNIFLTAKTRLISCRDRVCSYNNRIKILEQKVEVLKNSTDVPILWASAKYPEPNVVHESVFVPLSGLTPYYFPSPTDYIDDPPINKSKSVNEIINQALERSNKPTYNLYTMENCPPINSTQKENPLRQIFGHIDDETTTFARRSKNTQKIKKTEVSKSLLTHCEFGSNSLADPFSYKPTPGNINNFDFPEELPNLSESSRIHDIFGGSLDNLSKIDFDIDLSAQSSFYQSLFTRENDSPKNLPLNEKILNAEPIKVQQQQCEVNKLDSLFNTLNIESNKLLDPKDDLIFTNLSKNLKVSEPQVKTDLSENTLSNKNLSQSTSAPPPAPPPPPPVSLILNENTTKIPNNISVGHTDLMEAIRSAGGTKNARLKKVIDSADSDSIKYCESNLNSKVINEGEDLMTSLANALKKRRQGIAGKSNKFASFDKKKPTTLSTVDDANVMSRLRQIIPFSPDCSSENGIDDIDISDDDDWS